MKLYYHKIKASAQLMTFDDVEHIARLANVPLHLFTSFTAKSGTVVYTWRAPQPGKDSESIGISIPANALYGTVTLQGSFFSAFPDFPVRDFYQWVKGKQGNVKISDISFEDDNKELNFQEIRQMSSLENYKDFCTGSSVINKKQRRNDYPDSNDRLGIPDVHGNHNLIHYGNVSSPASAKAYVMATGNIKFELTVNDKSHNAAILDAYSPDSVQEWEQRAKSALVNCINFVKPSSKRSKRLVQVDSWQKFLGSPVKPIKWTDYQPELDAADLSFESALTRNIGQLQNMCRKFQIFDDVGGAIQELQERIQKAYSDYQALEYAF